MCTCAVETPAERLVLVWQPANNYITLARYNPPKMIRKLIGPKYMSIAKLWVPTLAVWGVAGGVALVHFTDWRLVLDYVPLIRGKFKKDD